jgi:hypothetical protein
VTTVEYTFTDGYTHFEMSPEENDAYSANGFDIDEAVHGGPPRIRMISSIEIYRR